ncbi:MAG: class I SAM-dependent methyltransferase [Bacteroidia bacterium]
MNCKICGAESSHLFKGEILNKYEIDYFQCTNCEFIQTEKVYWLEEAYSSAITDLDLGYITRNLMFGEIVGRIIKSWFNSKGKFIDYGGGYGMFVRLMRDRGFNYYRQDIYCENTFANHFDIEDLEQKTGFEILSAFEVFEHLDDPMAEMEMMLSYSDSIIFSTELQPKKDFKSQKDWWYFAPYGGQHIALYSYKSLEHMAKHFGLNLYSNKKGLHLLTKKKFGTNPVKLVSRFYYIYNKLFSRFFFNKNSFLPKDSDHLRKTLVRNQ